MQRTDVWYSIYNLLGLTDDGMRAGPLASRFVLGRVPNPEQKIHRGSTIQAPRSVIRAVASGGRKYVELNVPVCDINKERPV
jgi:hypothetical protein